MKNELIQNRDSLT